MASEVCSDGTLVKLELARDAQGDADHSIRTAELSLRAHRQGNHRTPVKGEELSALTFCG